MRIASISLFILVIINIVIGLNRNNGFNYTAQYSFGELYPTTCGKDCITKWTFPDKRYPARDLEEGRKFLQERIALDSLENVEEIIKAIAGFLYASFSDQTGSPGPLIKASEPLQQLTTLLTDSSQKLWCGNFQAIFGFLSTSGGLNNRYVEVIAGESVHEVNEIYSPTFNKWIMVDPMRNNILFMRENVPLSTAEYLVYQSNEKPGNLDIVKNKDDKTVNFDTLAYDPGKLDEYFGKSTFLRYYLEMDLGRIYSLPAKIKRYMIADPWFVVYDPVNKASNLLFRVKQFFIGALVILLLANIYLVLKKYLLK